METNNNLNFEKDFEKLKKVITHRDNEYLHLRNISQYINLFFKKWNDFISPTYENQIILLQNDLVKRLT
tara:strand:- start:1170 stop:1376 length:207 start_codon:yes stop_codon:yes gene_type:complete